MCHGFNHGLQHCIKLASLQNMLRDFKAEAVMIFLSNVRGFHPTTRPYFPEFSSLPDYCKLSVQLLYFALCHATFNELCRQ
jgi:hypothetical protein